MKFPCVTCGRTFDRVNRLENHLKTVHRISKPSKPTMAELLNRRLDKIEDKTNYKEYFDELEKRLRAGAEEYGDTSFEKQNSRLIEEIQQEVLDIAGWSYILWKKLENIKVMFI